MQYTDLKDGMICYLRDGRKCLVLTERMYEIKRDNDDMITEIDNRGKTYQWNHEELMLWDNKSDSDIIKVEYMGEIIWESVNYVSFVDAVNSGKKFKHKDWTQYFIVSEVFKILGTYNRKEDFEKFVNEVAWIIEQ